jgi:hypothetical protein
MLDTGGRIRQVMLGLRWRRDVGTGGLTAAVISACADAGERFVAQLDESLAPQPQRPSPVPAPLLPNQSGPGQNGLASLWPLRDVATVVTELLDRIAQQDRSAVAAATAACCAVAEVVALVVLIPRHGTSFDTNVLLSSLPAAGLLALLGQGQRRTAARIAMRDWGRQ